MKETKIINDINNSTVDLLDRDNFISQVINIIELLSQKKQSVRFAINGNWGVGKSFVLEKLEKVLENIQSQETSTDKYLLFHYNCWQYDYYEEPLVAIVASMLDTIDEKENLIPYDMKIKVKGFLKAVGSGLLSKANQTIEEKTGLNTKELVDILRNANEETAEKIEENHLYDSNFIFKSTLERLQKVLSNLSENKTIIFVVDELDRCLPEYSIKILERLHHIFEKVKNVQVILAIDKEQLSHAIRQIYGEETDVNKYLSKFFSFEIKLDTGNLNEQFTNKFTYYINNFKYSNPITDPDHVNDFQKNIFMGIDMRSRIEIINKCDLLHRILYPDEIMDFSVMCIEMLFAVIKYWEVDLIDSKSNFEIDNQFFYQNEKNIYTGLDYLNSMYNILEKNGLRLYYTEGNRDHVRRDSIWSAMLCSYRHILGFTRDIVIFDNYSSSDLFDHSIRFWELLQIIV